MATMYKYIDTRKGKGGGAKRRFKKRAFKYGVKASMYGAVGYELYRDVQKLKDMVNVEYKEINTQLGNDPITYFGTNNPLNLIPQGVGNGQRTGDSVKLQTLTLRGAINLNAAGQEGLVRLIILNDKNNIISAPSILLTDVGGPLAPFGNKQEDNKYETKILKDMTFKVSNQNPITPFKLVLPLNYHTKYTAGTTGIDNGMLRLIFISSILTNPPTVSWKAQLSYTDN